MYYTIDDFNDIFSKGMTYTLNSEIIQVIQALENIIGNPLPELNSKPKLFNKVYVDKRKFSDKSQYKELPLNDNDWKTIRNFKSTKIDVKEGIEKQINDIRISLNKISTKNYESYKNKIFEDIKCFMEEISTDEDRMKIVKAIFDIASSNKFYSEIYANLYKELIIMFSIFGGPILTDFMQSFRDNIHTITYIDPNDDYDGFCNYTKSNDIRKATSTFIINLMKNDILSVDVVFEILVFLQDLLFKYIYDENKINEVEEITENIFIFVSLGYSFINKNDKWTNIYDRILDISTKKIKEYPSLTNRAVFKHLDILDFISKNKKL